MRTFIEFKILYPEGVPDNAAGLIERLRDLIDAECPRGTQWWSTAADVPVFTASTPPASIRVER